MPEIAGGSVSSPRFAVATTHRGAPAHARVIIFRLFGLVGVAFAGSECTFVVAKPAKTTFRALKMGRRMRRALGFRADEAEKRVHTKRCDSSIAAKTRGCGAHPLKFLEKRPECALRAANWRRLPAIHVCLFVCVSVCRSNSCLFVCLCVCPPELHVCGVSVCTFGPPDWQKTGFHAVNLALICGYCGCRINICRKTGAGKRM